MLRDKHDSHSWTLFILIPGAVILTVKFALGGFFGFPVIEALHYGGCLSAMGLTWQVREYVNERQR